jgi:hypothetical protein
MFFAGLALTGSRMGTLFGLVFVGLVLTRNSLTPHSLRGRAHIALALAIGYAIGLLLTRYLLADANGVMPNAIERYGEGSFGQRFSMWSDAVRIIVAFPWLGVGVGEYAGAQYLFAQPHPSLLATQNPHNIVLHIAAEFGLPAAVAIVFIAGSWCWRRAAAWKQDEDTTAALACILFLLAHSLLEFPLWHLHFLVALALLVGLAEPVSTAPERYKVRAQLVLAPIGVATLCALAAMKFDYDAVASVWDRYLHERFDAVPHGPETITGVLGLKDMTYFKPQMERLYVELLPVQMQQGGEYLEVSERVLTRLGDVLLVQRHIQLLLQAGKIEEAYPHIARLKVFAGSDYPTVREQIEESIAQNGPILDPVRRQLAAP